MPRPRGLYDLILTESVARSLDSIAPDVSDVRELDADEAPERLLDALGRQLRGILSDIEAGDTSDAHEQLALVNELLKQLRSDYPKSGDSIDPVLAPPRVLQAIRGPAEHVPNVPETGLAAPWLFTAGKGSPSLLTELLKEAAACDQIDILVSFITVSGVRKLIDVLRLATAANASGVGRTKIRVLTTTYMGATEVAALDELAGLNGCEIRISLDGRRTRLHAKAWIFQRKTGFGSAYVGSANLSHSALMNGVEWTMKFTERGQGALFDRAKAHFDTLWLDDEFTLYKPGPEGNRSSVIEALRRESGEGEAGPTLYFDIEPKPYQREMLEQLKRERAQGRNRNLLVAATGTGKTVVAALDYRATCEREGHRPRLLFVAHRAQILRQALATYQAVLRDQSFGETLTGGKVPEQYDHLFASIDSLSSRDLVAKLGAEYWHTVVIDECHRLAANRFDRLATTIRPAQLLGLTATPERTDGQSIAKYFTSRPDGEPAVELRLWNALDMQLLAPFEYYACDDETDFSEVPWNGAGEVAAIDKLVTGNEVRARTVVNEWRRLTANPRKGRALVFCVSVAHARFMADWLTKAGLPAMAVTGETPKPDQMRAPRKLKEGQVCALVTVDLYNEGVDLPDVDTLIMLRPTQSPVLFQQQIGRGLRLAPKKESCLVLDFVGQHRTDFRFDRLLSSITGLTRRQLEHAVENGFSTLPLGCHIQLQRQTREQVLKRLRTLTSQSWRRLTAEVQTYATLTKKRDVKLGEFLHDQQIALEEIYRNAKPSGWTTLRRDAGLLAGEGSEAEATLSRRLGDLTHLDDPVQLAFMRRVAESPARYEARTAEERLRAQMLTYQVDSSRQPLGYEDMLARFSANPECAEELGELADVLMARTRLEVRAIPGLEDVPLQLHGAYSLREIATAFGWQTAAARTPVTSGVLPIAARKTELLFVTLDKSAGFHDRIAYRDYAVSSTRFHWQTQNSAGPDTTAGRRYVASETNGWSFQLFVRATKADAYRACGAVRVASAEDVSGDRPMNITWTLGVALPGRLFAEFSVLRGA